ncbi:MAG: site-specific integrase [Veillonella parvula]|uniref:tyrosine-type recombinase/integrase n=1 Tax=Veillonella parvula TaxID=29466 RepID=UPI001D8F3CE2|nr:site-specific integrase [Veillonella parvula]MBS6748844.1 site-specific integrase [Veillonella parvula]
MRRYAVILKRIQRNTITLRQLFNEWLPIHSQSISKSAIKSYHIAFKHISNIADMSITDIHFQHLQNVINSMHVKKLSYSSCKKVRTLLNQLFNYAIIRDYPVTNYALHLNLGPNRPTIKRRVFTRQQINKLWAIDSSYSRMILILLYTGLRIGELLNLRRQDINRRSSYLIVRHAKTKAGEGRIIPLHHRITPLIEQVYNAADNYLFPISYTSFRKHFHEIMKQLNCKHTIHDTRHTFASLLDAVAPPNDLRSLLGHKQGDITTRVYTHKTIRELRKAIELLK